jgi:isocitrate dehydrogenase (NAD+)
MTNDPTANEIRITELLGDGIGPELRESVHAIAAVLPLDLHFEAIDLSLESRRARGLVLYDEAVDSMRATRLALKYPTVTEAESPNAVLRRRLGFSVIHRPVFSIQGISSNFKENVALDIVRVATGGTYDDPGQKIGADAAVSLRIVERGPCREAARFAFDLAKRDHLSVTSSSKHTIQRVTDGLFESVVREVAREYPDVPHYVELFDALLAKIILKPERYQVVLVLNEYGDFLSDMACGLVGSLGMGASGSYSFTKSSEVDVAMFDPAGGTAPDIAGQGKCNPSAILFAFEMLIAQAGRPELARVIRQSVLDAIAEGDRTADIGGNLDTIAFTRAVGRRIESALGQ